MTASDMPEWAIPTQSSLAQGVGDLMPPISTPGAPFWETAGSRFICRYQELTPFLNLCIRLRPTE